MGIAPALIQVNAGLLGLKRKGADRRRSGGGWRGTMLQFEYSRQWLAAKQQATFFAAQG
jgi:hypothetical protein